MKRFDVLWRLAILPLSGVLLFSQGQAKAEDAIEIDSRAQLFVDQKLVDRMERVWLSSGGAYNTIPKKVPENPILKADRPWEGYLVLQPGSVIYDEQDRLFKMWYNTLPESTPSDIDQFICYAVSKDGVHWDKPELNLVEFQGSKANNILFRWSNWTHAVIDDGNDADPGRRFKMVYWHTEDRDRCGIWSTFSPDGIRWTDIPNNPVVPCWASGDTFSVTRDPVSKQYWLYHKTSPGGPRKVSRLISDDFIHWRDDRLVLEPDKNDPPGTEFYGLSAFPYGSQYLGLVWVFHTAQQTMYAQLVSSRDGVEWERSIYRRPFIVLGYMDNHYSGKSFDSGMVFPVSEPVVKDGEVWIYYSGFDNLHNAPGEEHTGQVGLMKIREDGFTSLDATAEGSVLTHPLRFDGSSLLVNVEILPGGKDGSRAPWKGVFNDNPNSDGHFRVEVLDKGGRPLGGYEASRSKLSPTGGVYQKVSWGAKKDVSGLKGKEVRLKFIFSRARLYSFKIE